MCALRPLRNGKADVRETMVDCTCLSVITEADCEHVTALSNARQYIAVATLFPAALTHIDLLQIPNVPSIE